LVITKGKALVSFAMEDKSFALFARRFAFSIDTVRSCISAAYTILPA